MNSIMCLEPVLIVNPSLNQSCARFDTVFIDGEKRSIDSNQRYQILTGSSVSKVLKVPFAKNLSYDYLRKFDTDTQVELRQRLNMFLDRSYLYSSETSEVMPLYMYVPCGHCDCCNAIKLNSYLQRAQFAMMESRCVARFVTLSINPVHIDFFELDPKRCIQLFKKRLKRQFDLLCEKRGFKCSSIEVKFVVSAERGKEGRLHYHLLIFGLCFLPYVDPVEDSLLVRRLVRFCWREPVRIEHSIKFETFEDYCYKYPMDFNIPADYDPYSYGYINISNVTNGSSAARYVMKYALKCDNDDSDKLVFKSMSLLLGVKFAESLRDSISNSRDGSFMYHDFFTNSVKRGHLSKYYINKLFPSESDLIPVEFRRSYYDIHCTIDEMLESRLFGKKECALLIETRIYLRERFRFLEVFMLSEDRSFYPKWYDKEVKLLDDCITKESYINVFFYLLDRLFDFVLDYDDVITKLSSRSDYLFKKFSFLPDLTFGSINKFALQYRKEMSDVKSKSYLN